MNLYQGGEDIGEKWLRENDPSYYKPKKRNYLTCWQMEKIYKREILVEDYKMDFISSKNYNLENKRNKRGDKYE